MSCGCGTTTRTGNGPGCGCGGGRGCGCGTTGLAAAGGIGASGFHRPRFFAGQLLSEDDLQAIVAYTAGKSRLHNRYLAGAGVVNGLEVICLPGRPGWVRVSAGYALDCCGEDIVVPCDLDVDVNQLIAALPLSATCVEPCPPDGTTTKHDGPCRSYQLTVVYAEEPAEYLSAYPVDDEPCASSGGGGCEVSLLREGYRIGLRCGCASQREPWMVDEIVDCLRPLFAPVRGLPPREVAVEAGTRPSAFTAIVQDLAPGLPDITRVLDLKGNPQQADLPALVDLRRRMIDLLERRGTTDCNLLCDITEFDVEKNPATAPEKLRSLLQRVVAECVCRAVNPQPPGCDDPEVVLATVCVEGCEVTEICNSARRHVVSGPALGYWLPFELLHLILEVLCCNGLDPVAALVEGRPHLGPLERSLLDQAVLRLPRFQRLADRMAEPATARPTVEEPEGASGPEEPAVDLSTRIDELQRQLDELRSTVAGATEAPDAASPPAPPAPPAVTDPAPTGEAAGVAPGAGSTEAPAPANPPEPSSRSHGNRRPGNGGAARRSGATPPPATPPPAEPSPTEPSPVDQPPAEPPPAAPASGGVDNG